MKFKKYQKKVEKIRTPKDDRTILDCLWVGEEALEIVHEIRQHVKDPSKPIDIKAVQEEMGDTLVSLTNLALDLGIDMKQVAEDSLKKLKKRVEEDQKGDK